MKKYFFLALCLLASGFLYSCGDDDPTPGPTPDPKVEEVSYYVYDAQCSKDLLTVLDVIGVKINLLNGVELAKAKHVIATDEVLKDSLLLDINRPYYVGYYAEGEPNAAFEGKTALEYPKAKDFKAVVVPYWYEECLKRGIDVKSLHLTARLNWYAQTLEELLMHTDNSRYSLDADFQSIKSARLSADATDEEVCKEMLAAVRDLLIQNHRIEYWNPETKRFVKE